MLPRTRKGIVSPRITTFDEFRDAISAYRLPRVLLAALELDLFTAVGDQSWTVDALSQELKVSKRGLSILCRNLAAAGVLQKKGPIYKNSRLGATALNGNHRTFRGGYLNLIRTHWGDWGGCWSLCGVGCRSTMMFLILPTIVADSPGPCITEP